MEGRRACPWHVTASIHSSIRLVFAAPLLRCSAVCVRWRAGDATRTKARLSEHAKGHLHSKKGLHINLHNTSLGPRRVLCALHSWSGWLLYSFSSYSQVLPRRPRIWPRGAVAEWDSEYKERTCVDFARWCIFQWSVVGYVDVYSDLLWNPKFKMPFFKLRGVALPLLANIKSVY